LPLARDVHAVCMRRGELGTARLVFGPPQAWGWAPGAPSARRGERRCGAAVNMKPFYDLVAEGTDPTAAWERTRPRIARDALYATWKRDFVAGGIGGGSGSFCSMHRIRCARSAVPPLEWAAPRGKAVNRHRKRLANHNGGKLFDQPGKAVAPFASAVGSMSCWLQGRRLNGLCMPCFDASTSAAPSCSPVTCSALAKSRTIGAGPGGEAQRLSARVRRPRRRMLREADSMVTRARMFEHKPDGDVNIFMLQARSAAPCGVLRRPTGLGHLWRRGGRGGRRTAPFVCEEPDRHAGGAVFGGMEEQAARRAQQRKPAPCAVALRRQRERGPRPRGAGCAGRPGGAVPGPAALPARHQVPDAGCAAGRRRASCLGFVPGRAAPAERKHAMCEDVPAAAQLGTRARRRRPCLALARALRDLEFFSDRKDCADLFASVAQQPLGQRRPGWRHGAGAWMRSQGRGGGQAATRAGAAAERAPACGGSCRTRCAGPKHQASTRPPPRAPRRAEP